MDKLNNDKGVKSFETLPHCDKDDDETWVTSPEKRLEQLIKERDVLDGKRGHLNIYRETDHPSTESSPHDDDDDDDDETWVTSPEMRLEQLEKERYQLDRKSGHLATSLRNRHELLREGDNLKAGLTCELCYVTTSDNDLMDQHLMGRSHLSNVEKQENKYKGDQEFKEKASDHVELKYCSREKLINDEIGASVIEITEKGVNLKVAEVEMNNLSNVEKQENKCKVDKKFKNEFIFRNEIEKASHVELKNGSREKLINDEIAASVIKTTGKGGNLKVAEVEINNNSKGKKVDIESDALMVEDRRGKDVSCDKTLIETTKKRDDPVHEVIKVHNESVNNEHDPLHKVIKAPNETVNGENDPLHVLIKAPNETVNEDKSADCDVCKIFLRGDGKMERHEIPAHACIGEDIGLLDLPAGWTQKVSRTSGVTYYMNNLTKEPQWVRPTTPVIFPEGTVTDQLPEGWVEKKSKSKGCPFYVNKITNQRQWERPTKALQMTVPDDLSLSTEREEEKLAKDAPPGTIHSKLKRDPNIKKPKPVGE